MIGPAQEPFRSVTQNMAPAQKKTNASQNANATATTSEEERTLDPCAWGRYKGDRVSVSLYHGRAYVHAVRGKDRVSLAMDAKNLAELSRIAKQASEAVAAFEDADPQEDA